MPVLESTPGLRCLVGDRRRSQKATVGPGYVVGFEGDSITSPSYVWQQEWMNTITAACLSHGKTAPTYVNHAIASSATHHMAGRVDDMIEVNPNLVICHIGTNDLPQGLTEAQSVGYYHQWWDDLLEECPNVKGFMVGVSFNTEDLITFPEAVWDSLRDAQRVVAESYGWPFVDLREDWQELTSLEQAAISSDGQHPTTAHGKSWYSEKVLLQTLLEGVL